MSASELQKQRMTDYFREAAKEILRSEGLKVANARNIAERAGYSYATLYNYFEDLPALIFECVKDFQAEIDELVEKATTIEDSGDRKLRAGLSAWVNYFIQYPGIFELFFLERLGETGNRRDTADTIFHSIEPACRPALDLYVSAGAITAAEADFKLEAIKYQVTGLMLYYSNRENPSGYNELIRALERLINAVMSEEA